MRRILPLLAAATLAAGCAGSKTTPDPPISSRRPDLQPGPVRLMLPPEAPRERARGQALTVRLRARGDDPVLLLSIGALDAAVVRGADAVRCREAAAPLPLLRAPAWDRAYALWINPRTWWVNDPPFRRWLAARVDRQAMLERLAAGLGDAPALLYSQDGLRLADDQRGPDPRSRPRLSIVRAAEDPWAARIAARLTESLQGEGVDLVDRPTPEAALAAEQRRERAALYLLAVEAETDGRSLLAQLADRFPSGAADLRGGAPLAPEGAGLVERELLRDGRWLPLIRLHAWLAHDPRLVGVSADHDGVRFADARWRR